MPKWNDYKKEAQERGSLAMELFVVRSKPAVAPEIMKEVLPAHLAYQGELEAKGTLVMAGPLSDESGDMVMGEGMMIYRLPTFEDAIATAKADPMHAQAARTFEIRKWLVNEGGLTLTVKFAGQTVSLS